jgi:hypothetical protein
MLSIKTAAMQLPLVLQVPLVLQASASDGITESITPQSPVKNP